MQLEKSDFLPIHKIHLIFGKYSANELIAIYKKFKIKVNFKKDIFSVFEKQKDFNEKSLNKALKNLNNNLVKKYIINKKKLDNKYPIISQL